jgi:integrase
MGFRERNWASEAIIIKRSDVEHVHDWARENCNLRDFLLIRLPMKIGLRNSEIRTLRIENINFHDHSFQVLDSKKHMLFPLPLDMLTLQHIQDLIGMRTEGYVFTHTTSWTYVKHAQPLSHVQIWTIIHEIAEKAGVKGFNPRILRHYFAIMYLREQEEQPDWQRKRRRTLETLRKLLRHSHLGVTQIYLSKLTFFEDMQEEYESVQNEPIVNQAAPMGFEPTSICNDCSNLTLCKFQPLPSCVTKCRFYAPKQEVLTTNPIA